MEEKDMQAEAVASGKKMDRRKIELALIFIIGILFGIAIKTEARNVITMGFDDYLITQKDKSAYDLNEIQKNVLASGTSTIGSGAPQGASCGQ